MFHPDERAPSFIFKKKFMILNLNHLLRFFKFYFIFLNSHESRERLVRTIQGVHQFRKHWIKETPFFPVIS